MLLGLLVFIVLPFVILSLFGIVRPFTWMVIGLIATVILGLGAILGFGLSAFFMDSSYFREMPINLMTADLIKSDGPAWQIFLIPYSFVADIVVTYVKVSFFYKPNFILWAAEAWTWWLTYRLIKS
jgi:hypothetical protein